MAVAARGTDSAHILTAAVRRLPLSRRRLRHLRGSGMTEHSPSASTLAGPPPAASRPACPGKVTWTTVPERDVSECVLPRGHRGDHRDGVGYPWNEGRWLD